MSNEDRVRDALDAFLARVRQDMEAHAGTLTADVVRLVNDPPARPSGEPTGGLVGEVRRIEQASSLSAIFDLLLDAVSRNASRTAVWLVDGDDLKVWNGRGFADDAAPGDLPMQDSAAFAAAVATRQPTLAPPLTAARSSDATAVIVPLVVGDDVVALLYAEPMPGWRDATELLARHASICLEKVTSARTVELLARPG